MKNITHKLFFVALLLMGTTIYAQESSEDMDLEELEEVLLVGSGVIDLAEDRKTPVAVSTITGEEIQKKIGTQDITMTLVNTPSVYVAGQSGGFGDSRIYVRGFDQTNTAYMLNGQPINGMEDGKMYWSNWSGMNDVANVVQIQRGLGSSKLAISSVGGTVNFVMNSSSKQQGGFAYAGFANDNYLKTTVKYDTGMNDKGWSSTFLLTHWQGDGYNEGNFAQGQTYFFSLGYKMNDKHNFNFLMTGAPQWHDQNFSKSIATYLEHGRKYNNNYGYYGDRYLTERRNFYHKPVFNLNWDYKIDDKSSLSTVLYASTGNGGGTGGRGQRIRTDEGYVDYDAIYAYNLSTSGAGGNFAAEGGYITRASANYHSWFGLVSNYETQLSDNLTFNVGLDARTYQGEHYRHVVNFHGLTSWQENIRLKDHTNGHQNLGTYGTYKYVVATNSMAANPWDATFKQGVDEGDRFAWNYGETINYAGLFTQLEYVNDDFSAFFQGAVSQQTHQRFDYYQYADQSLIDGTSPYSTGEALPDGITDGVDSEKADNFGFNAKAGVGFGVGENGQAYVNAGYYSRQPFHDNIYLNFTNQINPNTSNETIIGLEAGYSYSVPNFTANVNLYRTSWADRVTSSFYVEDDVVFYNISEAVTQVHQGIEIDFYAKPQEDMPYTLKGFLSVGDWVFEGDAVNRVQDEDQNLISSETVDVDGGKVGDAAQFTAGLGLDVDLAERLSFDTDIRFYDELYADVGAVKENLQLPSFHIVDMGLSWKKLLEAGSLDVRLNINNVFDNVYISELRTAIAAGEGTGVLYNGIDTANQGYFGLGRTWSLGLRYNF